MKRGKRFLEKDNWLIYVGTAIFFILAISLGIIMYMTSENGFRFQNQISQDGEKNQKEYGQTESASTEIGKKVEEQQNEIETSINTEKSNEKDTILNNKKNESNTSEVTSKVDKVEVNSNKQEIDEPDTNAETSDSTNVSTDNNKNEEIKKEITFTKPTDGEIICEFAKDNLVYSETLKEWITHTAIDIKTDKTSVIKSAADGVIKSIINDPRYGLTIVIEHDEGYQTVYSNLLTAEFIVEGEEVTQGQTIGTAGTTAAFESEMECHLHFEIIKDGEYLDPTIYLK